MLVLLTQDLHLHLTGAGHTVVQCVVSSGCVAVAVAVAAIAFWFWLFAQDQLLPVITLGHREEERAVTCTGRRVASVGAI